METPERVQKGHLLAVLVAHGMQQLVWKQRLAAQLGEQCGGEAAIVRWKNCTHAQQVRPQRSALKLGQLLHKRLLKQADATCSSERIGHRLVSDEVAMRSRLDPAFELLAIVLATQPRIRAADEHLQTPARHVEAGLLKAGVEQLEGLLHVTQGARRSEEAKRHRRHEATCT